MCCSRNSGLDEIPFLHTSELGVTTTVNRFCHACTIFAVRKLLRDGVLVDDHPSFQLECFVLLAYFFEPHFTLRICGIRWLVSLFVAKNVAFSYHYFFNPPTKTIALCFAKSHHVY